MCLQKATYDYDAEDADSGADFVSSGFRNPTAQYDNVAGAASAGRIRLVLVGLYWRSLASPAASSATLGAKPRIMLMGLRKYVYFDSCRMVTYIPRRSGKSSIVKVVFHKMSPNETMFLESTSKIQQSGASSLSVFWCACI